MVDPVRANSGRPEARDGMQRPMAFAVALAALLGAAPAIPGSAAQNRAMTARPPPTFRDCPDCPLMAVLPAGRFRMGSPPDEPGHQASEGPQHPVSIPRPFAIGVFDVTRADYARFVEATGYAPANPRCDWRRPTTRGAPLDQTPTDPAVCVNWTDANAYAQWLSATTGHAYRLPSEAEWEYAARAGSTAARPWGPDADPERANTATEDGVPATGRKARWPRTSPVGSYPPNRFGLFDMVGNVWQWTADCGTEDYRAPPPADCDRRTVRGGGWFHSPAMARSATRAADEADFRIADIGFRVARSL
jgi:formylglycine-generating enzyme required for sulfatase activity